MTRTAYGTAAMRGELRAVRESKPGTRNTTLNTAAFNLGSLVPAHLDETTVISALTEAALITTPDRRDDDPFLDAEIEATITSGVTAGMSDPRQVPDGYTLTENYLEELDRIAQAFGATAMGGWDGRRMKRVFPGVLQIAYEAGGPRNVALPISKVGIYAGMGNRDAIGKGLHDLVGHKWLSVRAPGGPGHSTRYDLLLPTAKVPLHVQDAPTLLKPGPWSRPDPATTGHDAARPDGLGPAGIRIWRYLSQHPSDWHFQAALARSLGVHASTISRHLQPHRPLIKLGLIEKNGRGHVRAVRADDLTALDQAAQQQQTLGRRDQDRARVAAAFQHEGFLTDDLRWKDPTDGTVRGIATWLLPELPELRLDPPTPVPEPAQTHQMGAPAATTPTWLFSAPTPPASDLRLPHSQRPPSADDGQLNDFDAPDHHRVAIVPKAGPGKQIPA